MADDEVIDGGPAPTPPGLSDDWPVAWRPVWGKRDGFLARLESRVVMGALRIASHLPEFVVRGTIHALACLAPLVDRRHARSARSFLRQALGDLPPAELERRVRDAFRHLLRVAIDSERLPRRVPLDKLLDHYEVVWSDEAAAVRDSDEGCIVLTGHIGNWEAAITVAPWVGLHPAYAISKPPANRPLSKIAQYNRELRGMRLIPRRGAMSDAPAILRAGGVVGMLMDQRARKRPVYAPLFGRLARCDRGAAVLLKRLRAPVITCACYMTGKPLHYRAEFLDVIRPEDVAGASIEEIVTRMNGMLERMILKAPDQYFWLHDRYRDTDPVSSGAAAPDAAAEEKH